jgi:hypothetical protein
MELIVRTAHGTADVSIDVHDRDVSLHDLIAAVTGQAAPNTALVDGRLANTSDAIASCGVLAGSVIDTLLDDLDDGSAAPVTVVRQLSGPGAGRGVPLGVGSYRVGPGRRQHVTELSSDATDVVAFDLDVTSSSITLTAGPQSTLATTPVALDGHGLDGPTPWRDETVVAGGRIFRLEEPPGPIEQPSGAPVGGFIIHNRPPGIAEQDRTVAEAIGDARLRAPRLWHRRSAGHSISTDIGLVPRRDTEAGAAFEPVPLELGGGRMVAITGRPPDRAALARAVLVDVCTRYGPADVDVVITTTPAELDEWDWAKWLPHIRWGSAVDLLTNDLEMAQFAERELVRPTVVIVTNDTLWNGPGSPLRSYVLDAPAHAALIVLTDARDSAPAPTQTIVDLDSERPGAARLARLDLDGAQLDLHVALVDIDTAVDVARHLAPLIDPDRLTTADQADHLVALDDIVRAADAETRWGTASGAPGLPVDVTIGSAAGVRVSADLGPGVSAVISGSSIDEAVDVAEVLTLAIASTWSPAEASLLLIDHRAAPSISALAQLRHHAGTFSARDAPAIDRLLNRLRTAVSGTTPGSTRIVVVIAGIAETELAAPGLVEGLVALATQADEVHLIVATARPLAALSAGLRAACSIEIAVDRYGGSRRATLHDRRSGLQTPFTPYDGSTADDDEISVRPFVFGRSPSALERRLERGGHAGLHHRDRAVDRAARQLAALAAKRGITAPRPLVPIPLPDRVLALDLWAAHAGDGVPLGLLDAHDADTPTAYWWQPGADGSRIFVGAPRSGVRTALEVLLVGIADRFATADIEVYVAEHNDRRRTAIAAIPHVVRTESPDHAGAVEAMLSEVAEAMHRRRSTADFRVHDHPSILVIARDVERLTKPAAAALTHLLAEGATVGINVAGGAQRPDGLNEMIRSCPHLVVGALTNPDHYAELRLERSTAVEGHPGRAQLSDATLVQLAEFDASFDSVLTTLISKRQATQ